MTASRPGSSPRRTLPGPARAVLHATARFHHPTHAREWGDPALAEELEAVYDLVVTGLDRAPTR